MAGSDDQWPGWARWAVLGAVEAVLDHERARDLTARSAGATDAQLTSVSAWVRSTRDQVSSTASGDEVLASLDQLGDLTREWPAATPLARAVARCRASARSLPTSSPPAPRRRGPGRRRGGRQ